MNAAEELRALIELVEQPVPNPTGEPIPIITDAEWEAFCLTQGHDPEFFV